jgi:hypothetical protein
MSYGMKKGRELVSVAKSGTGSVHIGRAKRRAFYKYNGKEIYKGKVSAPRKKNCEGFPSFYSGKNFKTALTSDIKQ